ncbi:MAG TPA: hypothetical protein VGN93_06200 [Shinella sp.]|jgi:hypothetical protein|uniref:hypothetical protein n=1 Tax=Shinella sp. TaxID=1870904 RepID=UPI002E1423A1|nr:hypothetical protein [Shinella sp.]
MKTKNPATGGRGRAQNIQHLGRADILDLTGTAHENLAARKLSQRFGMPATTARLLAELAGLGPRADREAIFPFTSVSQPFAGSHTYGV